MGHACSQKCPRVPWGKSVSATHSGQHKPLPCHPAGLTGILLLPQPPLNCFKVRPMTHLKASAVQAGWVPPAVGWVSGAACSEVGGRRGCEVPCMRLQKRTVSHHQPWSYNTTVVTNAPACQNWVLSSQGRDPGPSRASRCSCSPRPWHKVQMGIPAAGAPYPFSHAGEKEAHPGVRLRVGLGVESTEDLVCFGSSWTCAPHLQHSFSWAAHASGQPSFSLSCSVSSSGLWREMVF